MLNIGVEFLAVLLRFLGVLGSNLDLVDSYPASIEIAP
jgi:hypothetical protein